MENIDTILSNLDNQRSIIVNIEKRTLKRIQLMKLEDETIESSTSVKKINKDVEDDGVASDINNCEMIPEKENYAIDDILVQERKTVPIPVERSYFDVKTAARLAALRLRRKTKIGG